MPAILEAEDLDAQLRLDARCSTGSRFAVEAGGITTILGANGAGKTTTLRAVCGMVKTSGEVRFDGQRIDGKATEDIVRLGIAHTPEGRGTFVDLTVEENLRLGAYARRDRAGLARDLETRVPATSRCSRSAGASRRARCRAASSRCSRWRARSCRRPRLLLLDEPSLGLAPLIVREIFRIVRSDQPEEGVSVLLVEQNAAIALDLADHAYLLETGRVVMSGPADELKKDDAIRRSYLGY